MPTVRIGSGLVVCVLAAATHVGLLAASASAVSCPADFNGDEMITFEDFDAFVNAFESGDPAADFDRDGFTTFEDFDEFVRASLRGCRESPGSLFALPAYLSYQQPRFVTIGDIDLDGLPDIVTAGISSDLLEAGVWKDRYVLVHRNRGNGDLSDEASYDVGASPKCAAIGDLNGDGLPDLIVSAGTTMVLPNLGNGRFGPGQTILPSTYNIALADVDGDGRLDIITDLIRVRRNLGDLKFTPATVVASGSADGLFVGDIDGDGNVDLATENVYLECYYGDGAGSFTHVRVNKPGSNGRWTMADFNGDGQLDLAQANDSRFIVLPNIGSRSFGTALVDNRVRCRQLDVGDFNGDGRPDIVSMEDPYRMSVSLNIGEFAFAAPVSTPRPSPSSAQESVRAGDLNKDGFADAVVMNFAGPNSNFAKVLIGAGNGSFVQPRQYSAGGTGSVVAAADVDDDGKLDMIIARNQGASTDGVLAVCSNLGGRAFGPAINADVGAGPRAIATGDVDGDGNMDIATANHSANSVTVLRNSGGGVFGSRDDYPVGTGPTAIATADLDGNGHADVIVGNSTAKSISVLLSDAFGTLIPKVDYSVPAVINGIAAGDLDGDTLSDVIVATETGVYVLSSAGGGALLSGRRLGGFSIASGVCVRDMNGDGLPDIALSDRASTTIKVFVNDGLGWFVPQDVIYALFVPYGLWCGDFDSDGRIDLMTYDGFSGGWLLLRAAGDGTYNRTYFESVGGFPADFDQDGHLDLAAPAAGGFQVNYNNGVFPSP